ncbi:EthD domain-containing protein [Rhodococcus sp. ACPA1]|uniref:EthD domain-containing protein n=1 Tax=Rhodococcus sp. ACPA1 TaxID=2028572 RepID=UPI0015CB739A|nr:EthD domain-containing protein [Rhodococcus sp. ACPA1]
MIKIIVTGKRKPSLTLAEFDDYWNNHHGPLAIEVSDALHIRKYVQCVRLDVPQADIVSSGRSGSADMPDFIAELWFDSAEDMAQAFASPEGQKANQRLAADEDEFCDRSTIVCILAHERRKI